MAEAGRTIAIFSQRIIFQKIISLEWILWVSFSQWLILDDSEQLIREELILEAFILEELILEELFLEELFLEKLFLDELFLDELFL